MTVSEVKFVELDTTRVKMTAWEAFGDLYDEAGDRLKLICGLTDQGELLCGNSGGEWFTPQLFEGGNKPFSAIAACGDTFFLATDRELVAFNGDQIERVGENGFPFKPPSVLTCFEAETLWALPADELAENPWFFDGKDWEYDRIIFQNRIDVGQNEQVWGIKWEVNEDSELRNGEPIDFTPFTGRWKNETWDLFYSSAWEEGLWGVATGYDDDVWLTGSQLVRVTSDMRWYRFPGLVGPVFTPLPGGKLVGGLHQRQISGILYFDGARTQPVFADIVDWPADQTPLSMAIDGQNRIWFGTDGGIVLWNGATWIDITPIEVGLPVDRLVQLAVLNEPVD